MFKFHHTAITVSNVEKSLNFYKKFGFEKVAQWQSNDKSKRIIHLKLDDFYLELFWQKDNKPAPESTQNLETDLAIRGVKHFGLSVDSIEKAREKILNGGLAVEISITDGKTDVKYFFIKDPDGILLEILEDKRNL